MWNLILFFKTTHCCISWWINKILMILKIHGTDVKKPEWRFTYLLIYFLTYFLTYLLIYLFTYLLIYLFTYLFTYLIIYLHIYLLTYLLIPWYRALLENLTGLQLVKKFPASHGTRRFITALTNFRHLSLSWASPIKSIYPHPTSWRSILILSTHLRLGLPSGLLHPGFPTKTLYTPLS